MPSLSAILFAASEKLQINFRRSLSSSMLAHVTMPLLAGAVVGTHQRYSKTKRRKQYDIKKFEAHCSFQCNSSTGSSRHAGPGVWTKGQGSVGIAVRPD